MKKMICFVLLMCFCLSMAACGASNNASAASDKSSASPVASEVAPSAAPTDAAAPSAAPAAPSAAPAAPTPSPVPVVSELQSIVDSLNEEEVAQRTEDDPSIGVFEVAKAPNTINYKFAMNIFQYVILMAEMGDAESLNAYNRLVDSLPPLEGSLENALRESIPDINVDVLLMVDEYSDEVAALVHNGQIIYDRVNGVGTAPEGITSILKAEDLPPEVQEKLNEMLSGETSAAPQG